MRRRKGKKQQKRLQCFYFRLLAAYGLKPGGAARDGRSPFSLHPRRLGQGRRLYGRGQMEYRRIAPIHPQPIFPDLI